MTTTVFRNDMVAIRDGNTSRPAIEHCGRQGAVDVHGQIDRFIHGLDSLGCGEWAGVVVDRPEQVGPFAKTGEGADMLEGRRL